MTIRHLRIFLAVCESNCNTTKAAISLHMTQPAVSLAIKELEQYYGTVLFERFGKRLQISEAGSRFLEYTIHILSLFDDMEKQMKDWDTISTLRIGSSITIGSQFLPDYVKAFQKQHPKTELKILIAPSNELEQKIISNELDFALIEGFPTKKSIYSEEYMDDHLTIICPNNRTFYQGQSITIEEFKNQKFLLREPGSGTREVFNRVIENAGFSVTPVWESASTTALINAVVNGLGIAILPHRRIVDSLERGLIVSIKVNELNFNRKFNIIYHKDKYLTSSAKEFIDLCKNYKSDYPIPNQK